MARMSIGSYAKRNGYALSQRQLAYWAKVHKKAVDEGDKDTIKWIEDMLTYINYHVECACFMQGKYSEVLVNLNNKHNYGKEYLYKGKTVIPYGSFKDRNSVKHINFNMMLNIPDYNYEDFYKAVENSEADVFIVKGFNQFLVPSAKGLVMIPSDQVKSKIKHKING